MKFKPNSILKNVAKELAIDLAKKGAHKLAGIVINTFVITIAVRDIHVSYNIINKELYALNPEKYNKYRGATFFNKNHYSLNDNIMYFLSLPNNTYFKVETYLDSSRSNPYSSPDKILKISIFGPDKYKYKNKLLKNVAKYRVSDDSITLKYLKNDFYPCDIIPHTFNQIILDKEIKSNIINGLINWNNSKEWYKTHQLVHKIGILLYGKPGTGKSTIAKAISVMFNKAPIFIIEQENTMRSIESLLETRRSCNDTMIVLIEDFDMFFTNSNRDSSKNKSKSYDESTSNQNIIFQLLDGVFSTENTIYIATTNYKDKLDSALIRHGRFDIQAELDYFNHSNALKFVEMFGYDESILDNFDISYPVQPALLQSRIMEYRSTLLIGKS